MLNPRSLCIPSAEECLRSVQEYRADFLLKNLDHQFMSSAEDSARGIIEVQVALRNRWVSDGTDGGTTWGPGIKYVAKDGLNGSDGNPKGYLQSIKITEITENQIKSALIEGAVIRGGRLESETKIDVGTDAYIGNNLYLGERNSGVKMLKFNESANISSPRQDALQISAEYLKMLGITSIDMGTGIVDFSNLENINWGKNAPVAVFGGDDD